MKYQDFTPKKKKQSSESVSRCRKRKIKELKELHGGACRMCGYSRCFRALEFHHRVPKHKKFSIGSKGMTRGWNRLVKEAKKCDLLCANCHREVEDGMWANR